MLNKILKIIRSFKRSPMLLFVNLPGLAIALSAFLLLMVYIKHQTSYDNHFENKDRVVRLYNTIIENNSNTTYPLCVREAYSEIPNQVPEIESACQFYRGWQNIISLEGKSFDDQNLLYVDKEFFNVFGLELLSGDANSALTDLNTTVLSKSFATKLFGNLDCVDKIININDKDYLVKGVVKDMPLNTHFKFDLLVSISTIKPEKYGSMEFFTYYLLRPDADFAAVEKKIGDMNDVYLAKLFDAHGIKTKSGLDRLLDIHLHTHANFDLSEKGNISHIYIIGFLAAFILLIAIINYVNLFVLSGEKRFLEIGIRKTLGANLRSLRIIFFTETAILTLIAFVIAIFISNLALPIFSNIMKTQLSLMEILNPFSIIGVVVFLIVLILIAGGYPAFYLSRLDVIEAVKGGSKSMKRKKWLTISAVVIQFSISIFLIVSLLIANFQINYLKDVPLGFKTENIIGISGFDNKTRESLKSIKEEIVQFSFVKNVATSNHFMGGGYSGQGLYIYGQSKKNVKSINQYRIQDGFCELMQIELVEGRFFNGSQEDKSNIILNEAAVKMMGIEDPMTTSVVMHSSPLKIIGVVKDFYYFENAGVEIAPLAITGESTYPNVLYVKTYNEITKDQAILLENVFSQFSQNYNFDYFYLSNQYEEKFYNEERLLNLLLSGTLLAIFLSFIGMYALSAYSVEKRVKEIGVRKVLGSSSKEIMFKLLYDILKWVVWSMPVAFLMSYLVMNRWLNDFANGIQISLFHFVIGGLLALLIAIIAVSIKSFVAANKNPVESLRDE
jgi:putative ABC transport system permease protein